MADFCKQCSLDHFGKDFGDLAGITTAASWEDARAACVLCEGCGAVQVAPDGTCLSLDCLLKHGLADDVQALGQAVGFWLQ